MSVIQKIKEIEDEVCCQLLLLLLLCWEGRTSLERAANAPNSFETSMGVHRVADGQDAEEQGHLWALGHAQGGLLLSL
jgi:hypothetical protein